MIFVEEERVPYLMVVPSWQHVCTVAYSQHFGRDTCRGEGSVLDGCAFWAACVYQHWFWWGEMLALFDCCHWNSRGALVIFVPVMGSIFHSPVLLSGDVDAVELSPLVQLDSWRKGEGSISAERGCGYGTECRHLKLKQFKVGQENRTDLSVPHWMIQLLVDFQT